MGALIIAYPPPHRFSFGGWELGWENYLGFFSINFFGGKKYKTIAAANNKTPSYINIFDLWSSSSPNHKAKPAIDKIRQQSQPQLYIKLFNLLTP